MKPIPTWRETLDTPENTISPNHIHASIEEIQSAMQDEIDALSKRVQELDAAQTWKPIESAPASAEPVLCLSESGRRKIETGHWLRNLLHAAQTDGDKCNYTHWMPLPQPPVEKDKP